NRLVSIRPCARRRADRDRRSQRAFPSPRIAKPKQTRFRSRRQLPPQPARPQASSDDLFDHFTVDFSQPLAPPLMHETQRILTEPELIQNRSVDVAEMVWLLDRAQANGIG